MPHQDHCSFPSLPFSPPLIHSDDNDDQRRRKSTTANDDGRGEGEGTSMQMTMHDKDNNGNPPHRGVFFHFIRDLLTNELLSSEFRRRCRVQSRARRWLQIVGCAALLLDASNFGGPDGVGESGIEPRRSLRKMRAS